MKKIAEYGILLPLYIQESPKLSMLLPGLGSQSFNFFSCMEKFRGSVDCLPGQFFYPGHIVTGITSVVKHLTERCRVWLQLAGQKMATSKILSRPLATARRYDVVREITIFLTVGKGRPWQLFQTLALHVRLAVMRYTDILTPPSQGAVMPTVSKIPDGDFQCQEI